MRRRLPLLSLALAFTTPAAAHDAPLALVEAMEAHLLDCPSSNGYGSNGDMLSLDWERAEVSSYPIMEQRISQAMPARMGETRLTNIYTVNAGEFDLVQAMSVRMGEAKADTLCLTIVADLPFMPSGKLLEAVFGDDVSTGIANSPGDYRDGSWIWESTSPTHKGTLARYTNSYDSPEEAPEDVFYPGFYIMSRHTYEASAESEQP